MSLPYNVLRAVNQIASLGNPETGSKYVIKIATSLFNSHKPMPEHIEKEVDEALKAMTACEHELKQYKTFLEHMKGSWK